MLENKRSNSVFKEENMEQDVPSAGETGAMSKIETPEMEKRIEELLNSQKSQKSLKELGTENRTHSIFFMPESEKKDFQTVLKDVQEYISNNYSVLITNQDLEDAKEQMKRYIGKYVMDERIAVNGMDGQELIDALYTEMAEYGFLTKYIFGKGIEEIDINSWRDIEVQYSDGRNVKLEEHFDSPEHAINVIRRMLHVSGIVLDNASPAVLGHLSKNIRIAVLKTPLVDEDVGIAASIRIVNPQSMKKEDFVRSGTATEQMLDFLSNLVRYGISVCVAGATSSGKTTVLGKRQIPATLPNRSILR